MNNVPLSPSRPWQPTATIASLKARATLLADIRAFFAARDVFEVETPQACRTGVTAPYLDNFTTKYTGPLAPEGLLLYLQTSPEYAMKRLLAADSGCIYQLAKVFRDGEAGRWHNPEFTMLEWYRVGFDHHQLMDEVDALVQHTLKTNSAKRMSYKAMFEHYLDIDPYHTSVADLKKHAEHAQLPYPQSMSSEQRDEWLQLLMTHLIEPQLGFDNTPVFIDDFPASQASLARMRRVEDYAVGERFEIYVNGVELANGFHELTDAQEQRQRFMADNEQRQKMGLPVVAIDEDLLAALSHGLPACAGVALGVDRLFMLQQGFDHIEQAISFPLLRS